MTEGPTTEAGAPLLPPPDLGQSHRPQVHVHREEVLRDGQRLGTLTITPIGPHDPSPLIVTLGIMAHLEISEEQRFWLLADRLRRPVIALDTPGWTVRGGALPTQVRSGLRRGGFEWLGSLLAEVVLTTHPTVLQLAPSVLGYSLGASTASALAADLSTRGAALRGLTLVEPVAVRRQSPVELAWRNMSDARHSQLYTGENTDVAWAAPASTRRPIPRAIELSLLVWAISRGRIPDSVAALPTEVPIMIISGERSQLAPVQAIGRLAIQLRRSGRRVEQHVVPDAHHALWNSLPHVNQIVERII